MRPVSPAQLQQCVKDFLDGVDVLPNWIESSASERPGRGHYEWGNWSDAMRATHLWMLGGPWRTIVADVKRDELINTVSEFHKVKDQMVWEIVEQTYFRAEAARQSSASEETVKTRIRSVFSWQRRHDGKKHSLMWFLDFAFTLLAYSLFQAHMLFSNSPIPKVDVENIVPQLSPADFGKQVIFMEQQMFSHNFLPFYCRVNRLTDQDVLLAQRLARTFCEGLPPPVVDMDVDVRETRGMPREEKAVDFMTPWLRIMEGSQHETRWTSLVQTIHEKRTTISSFEPFKTELCRAIVASLLIHVSSSSEAPEAGYVYDIAATTAVEQSERELLVSLRLPGQKRKKTVSRRTLRSDLDARLQNWSTASSSFSQQPLPITWPMDRGSSSKDARHRNDTQK